MHRAFHLSDVEEALGQTSSILNVGVCAFLCWCTCIVSVGLCGWEGIHWPIAMMTACLGVGEEVA